MVRNSSILYTQINEVWTFTSKICATHFTVLTVSKLAKKLPVEESKVNAQPSAAECIIAFSLIKSRVLSQETQENPIARV